jgi:hypothetical protein
MSSLREMPGEKVVVERIPRDRAREGGWVKRREKCRLYRVGRER